MIESGQVDRRNFASIYYLDSHGREQVAYDMTRDGFMLLVMGFTGAKALEMKLHFIAAFNAMEAYIHNTAILVAEAKAARIESKAHRHEFTDRVKMLVDVAKSQGSTGHPFIFADLTKTTYKVLGLFAGQKVPDGFRDRLTKREIEDCIAVETAMERTIERLLAADNDGNYKTIRDAAKQAARTQAGLLGYEVA